MDRKLTICGVDPGKSGALVNLDGAGVVRASLLMPVCTAANGKTFVDGGAIAAWLRATPCDELWLEDVYSMPDDTPLTALSLGDSKGVVKGVAWALGIKLRFVHPSVWKRDLGCTRDKDTSRARARALFGPRLPPAAWKRNGLLSTEGKCEAALIGLWGLLNDAQ